MLPVNWGNFEPAKLTTLASESTREKWVKTSKIDMLMNKREKERERDKKKRKGETGRKKKREEVYQSIIV